DAPAAKDTVELVLVGRVVGDGGRRVLQLVAGEDAHDSLARLNNAFFAKQLGAGDAGRAGRFAAQAVGAHLGLGVEHLLVGYFAHHAVAALQRANALVQIHRAVDFDRAGDRGSAPRCIIEFRVVVVDDARIGPAVIPTQAA